MKCDYCLSDAELVGGDAIYPHRPDLYHKNFYQCKPCDAWVGCHPNTTNPLGRLADSTLRQFKSAVHRLFDPLWKNKTMKRGDAYSWLAKELAIPVKECHVGMFDIETCQKALNVLTKKRMEHLL